MGLTPEERRARAKLAAHARWAKHDRHKHAAKMRAVLEQRFIDEVDPDRVLPEAERQRRAESARKAYFARMAFESL